jgi:hypothetical protein
MFRKDGREKDHPTPKAREHSFGEQTIRVTRRVVKRGDPIRLLGTQTAMAIWMKKIRRKQRK